MAGKPKNRLELRRQYEAAEDLDPVEDEAALIEETDDEETERKPKKKKVVKPKAPKATKAAKPAARMRVVWAVVSDAFKTVATFEYNQRDAALAKAEEMNAKGKGTYFVQRVKEAMPDDAPGLGATIPRATPTPVPILAIQEDSADTEDDDDSGDDDEDADEDEGMDDDD